MQLMVTKNDITGGKHKRLTTAWKWVEAGTVEKKR